MSRAGLISAAFRIAVPLLGPFCFSCGTADSPTNYVIVHDTHSDRGLYVAVLP